VGVVGELFIGGSGVARGYGGRPELTAERFVADPFAGDGSRLYRSGDRVRWLPEGELEFLGRVDHQVKIRGFRVEPGEIEAALRAHPAIETAVVVAREDDGDRRLVAYLVPGDLESGLPSTSELRAFLLESLPEHLVPAVFVELAAVPLTSNGKLDRAALPAPESVRPELAVEFAAPRTPAEEILAGVWAEVLGLESVGVTDNFFELGGHSLLVAQAVARTRAAGYDISVTQFFDHPTVAALAPLARAREDLARPEPRSLVEIRRGTVLPAVFCVHASLGGVTEFSELAAALGDGQRFYGLQARGLVDDDRPLETIEEMAAAYLEEVLAVQPEGPYLFAAWSMGCYVAVEMARQAAAQGREVAGVFMVGPPHHELRKRQRRPIDRRTRKLLDRLDHAIRAEPGTRLAPAVEEEVLEYWEPEAGEVAALRAGAKQQLRTARAGLVNYFAETHYRAGLHDGPGAYDGRVVLYMPEDDPAVANEAVLGQWRTGLAREPEVVPVPGLHKTVIRGDGARTVGSFLSAEIARREQSIDEI
ncbi:alpha/beta fold hydrolase, partial [Streptosporangium subroseum]|uniref:alpha/beta fold hydrolase n=1 Tax=Streptosporangium subroseum TaxID=106412 RepID=UPI003435D9DA